MTKRAYKRRSRLPKPRFQLRLVLAFTGLSVLALLAHTLVVGVMFMRIAAEMPSGSGHLAEAIPPGLIQAVILSIAVVMPALILIGISIVFRIAGPIFRFERHLEQVAAGEWPGPCKIRRTDDLQDFCQLLNDGLEGARAFGAREGTRPATTEETQAA